MRPDGLKVVGLECDVSSEVSVGKAFTRTLEVFGRVDVVVASAGERIRHFRLAMSDDDIAVPRHCRTICRTRVRLLYMPFVLPPGIGSSYALLSYPSDRMKRLYDINVHGAFFTAREAAKYMIPQGGGSIILVASMSANVCLPLLFSSTHFELYCQVVNLPQVSPSPSDLSCYFDLDLRSYKPHTMLRKQVYCALFGSISKVVLTNRSCEAHGIKPCRRVGEERCTRERIEA
jgi:NAD(P)-dependent dehydrogenase (short-subunit alcohol dehydrogenase family)